MKLLTAAEILGKDDSLSEDVACPEWGGSVRIRSLSAEERESFEESVTKTTGSGQKEKQEVVRRHFRSKLVAKCAVDESGARLFTDAQVEELGKKNAAPIDRCFAVAQRLSGLSAADVEVLAGKSETVPGSSSSTG